MTMTTTTTLYHGSTEKLTEIRVGGAWNVFDGCFFAYSRGAAASHGSVITEIELDESEILSSGDFTDSVEEVELAKLTVSKDYPHLTAEDLVCLVSSALSDDERAIEIARGETEAERSWEIQRLRGRIASALGYRAVEMNDEHGTTVLVTRL